MPVINMTISLVQRDVHVRVLELESLLGQFGQQILVKVNLERPEIGSLDPNTCQEGDGAVIQGTYYRHGI